MRARIRSVKPELLTDEDLWDLGLKHPSLHILQAFEGLWMYSDREGRFEWRPRALGALILPYWNGDFGACLSALEAAGFVFRYVADGREYGLVVGFKKHQTPNPKEEESRIPPPLEAVPIRIGTRENLDLPTESGEKINICTSGKGTDQGRELIREGKGASAPAREEAAAHLPKWQNADPANDPGWTANRQRNAFVRAYEAAMSTTPGMGGKQVGEFHATVVRTAELQSRDPGELFGEVLAAWLAKPKNETETRAPYACFQAAWGSLTAAGAQTQVDLPPKTVKGLRAAASALVLSGDTAGANKMLAEADELESADERRARGWGRR